MKVYLLCALAFGLVVCGMSGCAPGSANSAIAGDPSNVSSTAAKTMRAFRSERELREYFRELAEKQKREMRSRAEEAAGAPAADKSAASESQYSSDKDESVTNVQHAGVDEGGIVKLHGNHLVVLRRGRLFTVAIGDRALKPISTVDAFGPEIDPRNTWYDE